MEVRSAKLPAIRHTIHINDVFFMSTPFNKGPSNFRSRLSNLRCRNRPISNSPCSPERQFCLPFLFSFNGRPEKLFKEAFFHKPIDNAVVENRPKIEFLHQ